MHIAGPFAAILLAAVTFAVAGSVDHVVDGSGYGYAAAAK